MQYTTFHEEAGRTARRLYPALAAIIGIGGLGGSAAAEIFDSPLFVQTGSEYLVQVATGDLDGDGDIDLAADEVIIENLGDGALAPPAPHGGSGRSTATGDMDGDGDLDVVMLGSDGLVAIYLNAGGTFVPATTDFPGCCSLAVGDMNGDGQLDVVTGENIIFGDGNGGLAAAFAHAVTLQQVSLDDIDADGDRDLVGLAGGVACIGWNDGAGQLAIEELPVYSGAYEAIAVGDVNGDGRLDIVGIGSPDPRLVFDVYMNSGGAWSFPYQAVSLYFGLTPGHHPLPGTTSVLAWKATLADLDLDGVCDLIASYRVTFTTPPNQSGPGYSSHTSRVTLYAGEMAPQWTTNSAESLGSTATSLLTTDLDADGDLDAVIGTMHDGARGVNVLRNLTIPSSCAGDFSGDGLVAFADLTRLLSRWGSCVGCVEDLDGDDAIGFSDLTTLITRYWGSCF